MPRNRLKERQKEDALYEGKEKFVTAAYKRKLEADRKWLEEVRERELKSRTSKGAFMTKMLSSRANEEDSSTKDKEPSSVVDTKEDSKHSQANTSSTQLPTLGEEEDDDDFDGFIMAPEEDQIKGNVSEDEEEEEEENAGFIMAPKENTKDAHRSRSRSRSRSKNHDHSRHHHHSHHRHHHRHHFHFCLQLCLHSLL